MLRPLNYIVDNCYAFYKIMAVTKIHCGQDDLFDMQSDVVVHMLHSSFIETLKHVLCLTVDECVVAVSCGRSHTVCASASGRVFCWGENTHCQCGVIDSQIVVLPQYVPVVTHSDENLKQSLSESHNSMEELPSDRNSGHKDATGSGGIGRICSLPGCCHRVACHASQTGCSHSIVNAKIVQVSCGWTHTAALSNCGKLWAWGTGIQIGIADCISVPVPYPVEFPANRQVVSVSCGGQHTIALTVRREGSKFNSAAVSENLNSGVSRTVSCTTGMGTNTSEPIKLSDVPPEAKKGTARCSTLNQQSSDTNVVAESIEPVVTVNKAVNNEDIPMHDLASSSLMESGKDGLGYNCMAETELLESTCIDDVYSVEMKSDCNLPVNVYLENSNDASSEKANQSCYGCNVQSISTLRSSGSAYAGCPNVPKSRSSFLDETEAIIFLEKQLSDASSSMIAVESRSSKDRNLAKEDSKDAQDVAASQSPFAKTVESILQRVPSSPVVQEYMSNLTRTVVSNLRTSVDRRLNYVTSQVELSLNAIASLNKVAESGETDISTALDDTTLLERLALANCVSLMSAFESFDSLSYLLVI